MTAYKQLVGDKDVTIEQANQIVEATREHLTREGLSQMALARRLGIGASSLSMFLSNLAGDWKSTAADIDHYLARESSRVAKHGEYVETRVAKQILNAAKTVIQRGGIGLVYGGSGIGKTTAINRLRESTSRHIVYVSAATATCSIKGMLLDIATAIGFPCYERSIYAVFSQVCERLRCSGALLVVDEAHEFIGRERGESCYDVLRDLLVRTDMPQFLVGAVDLVRHFNRRVEQGREPLAQILSRVTIAIDLNDLKDADGCIFTSGEVRKLIACWPLKPDAQALRYLVKLANLTNQGGLRLVRNLYAIASEVAVAGNKPEVTLAVIEHAQSFLASRNARRMVKARLADDERISQADVETFQEARRAIA